MLRGSVAKMKQKGHLGEVDQAGKYRIAVWNKGISIILQVNYRISGKRWCGGSAWLILQIQAGFHMLLRAVHQNTSAANKVGLICGRDAPSGRTAQSSDFFGQLGQQGQPGLVIVRGTKHRARSKAADQVQ